MALGLQQAFKAGGCSTHWVLMGSARLHCIRSRRRQSHLLFMSVTTLPPAVTGTMTGSPRMYSAHSSQVGCDTAACSTMGKATHLVLMSVNKLPTVMSGTMPGSPFMTYAT